MIAVSGDQSTPAENLPASTVRRGWLERVDLGLFMIVPLPWVILRFDSSWLFGYAMSPFGFIDPWVYFGFFLDLTQHIRTFKGAYFTTRLTWTVPGAIVYHFFPPLVATYVLHLALFYAATVSLYLILKITVSQRAAVLATLLMAFHSYFLWSIGWPYMDGAGSAYLLMMMAALTFASRSARPKGWLATAGALAAMTVYCQLFLIVFSPVVLGYFHFGRREWGRNRPAPSWKAFAWGFAAVTAIFGIFNMVVNGRFLFFINSLGTAAKLVVHHNPYNDSTYGWLSGATWLVLPTVAFLGAVLLLMRKESIRLIPNVEFLLFWQRFYILSVVTMVFWQLVGQPVLQLSTYTSYLIPAVFLALGSQIAIVAHRLNRAQFLLLCGCVIFVFLLPFTIPLGSGVMTGLQRHPLLLPFGLGAAAVAIFSRQVRYASVLAVLLLCLSLAALNATTGPRVWGHRGEVDDPAFQKSALLTIVDSVRTVQELDPKGNLYFWYDGAGRLGRLYRSVASTYLWAYRLQSESFPLLGPKLPPAQRRILILAEDGEAALRLAEDALNREGLSAEVLEKRTIHEAPFTWDMIEIQVAAKTAAPSGGPG
ncbi:MAG: hypothetical protein WA628_24170 [Terriglobales bacterium]